VNAPIARQVDAMFYSPINDGPLIGARGNVISALLRLWLQTHGNIAALYNAWAEYKTNHPEVIAQLGTPQPQTDLRIEDL